MPSDNVHTYFYLQQYPNLICHQNQARTVVASIDMTIRGLNKLPKIMAIKYISWGLLSKYKIKKLCFLSIQKFNTKYHFSPFRLYKHFSLFFPTKLLLFLIIFISSTHSSTDCSFSSILPPSKSVSKGIIKRSGFQRTKVSLDKYVLALLLRSLLRSIRRLKSMGAGGATTRRLTAQESAETQQSE